MRKLNDPNRTKKKHFYFKKWTLAKKLSKYLHYVKYIWTGEIKPYIFFVT